MPCCIGCRRNTRTRRTNSGCRADWGGAPTQEDSRAIRLSELQERMQKYGTDGVTRPGQTQSGLH